MSCKLTITIMGLYFIVGAVTLDFLYKKKIDVWMHLNDNNFYCKSRKLGRLEFKQISFFFLSSFYIIVLYFIIAFPNIINIISNHPIEIKIISEWTLLIFFN